MDILDAVTTLIVGLGVSDGEITEEEKRLIVCFCSTWLDRGWTVSEFDSTFATLAWMDEKEFAQHFRQAVDHVRVNMTPEAREELAQVLKSVIFADHKIKDYEEEIFCQICNKWGIKPRSGPGKDVKKKNGEQTS